jgi:hypothetical protein
VELVVAMAITTLFVMATVRRVAVMVEFAIGASCSRVGEVVKTTTEVALAIITRAMTIAAIS